MAIGDVVGIWSTLQAFSNSLMLMVHWIARNCKIIGLKHFRTSTLVSFGSSTFCGVIRAVSTWANRFPFLSALTVIMDWVDDDNDALYVPFFRMEWWYVFGCYLFCCKNAGWWESFSLESWSTRHILTYRYSNTPQNASLWRNVSLWR